MSGPAHGAMDDPHGSRALILARLGAGQGRRILDVGAGQGLLAGRLTEQGWEVTAIERDPGLAARARGRCREVVVADLERGLPVLAGPYHAAVYGGVLQHLSDPLWVLRGLNRAMTPDAVVIASGANVAHLGVRLSLLVGRFDYSDCGILDRSHLRFFTRKSFRDLLEAAGLVVGELHATPIPLPDGSGGRWRRAAHAVHAAAARGWAGGLGYEFVALSTLAVTERAVLPAAWREPAAAAHA